MPRDQGRIDWMPRLKKWRAIYYKGRSDVKIGDYATRDQAVVALRKKIKGG